MTMEPVYTPATWFVAGCTCAPTHTNIAPVPLRVGVAPAAGENVAGRVNDRVTGVLAWPLTSNRPPFVRSVALTVLLTPGKTFPKLNCWAPTTLIGVCTLAVAVMLALL